MEEQKVDQLENNSLDINEIELYEINQRITQLNRVEKKLDKLIEEERKKIIITLCEFINKYTQK